MTYPTEPPTHLDRTPIDVFLDTVAAAAAQYAHDHREDPPPRTEVLRDRATPNQLLVAAAYDQAHGDALTRCANQLRAAVELIGPDDMTPAAVRVLRSIADEWDPEPCPDCVPRPFSTAPLCPTHQDEDDERKAHR